MKFVKQKLKGICKDISFEGKGVVNTDVGIVFVDNCFIGEEVEIETSYKRNGQLFGKIIKLITKSKDRIDPKCKVCSSCGGCQFQQLSYPAQLEYKKNKVKSTLKRYLKEDIEVLDTIGMDNPYHYRNKVAAPVGVDNKGKSITGFYRNNTHQIIQNDTCCINDDRTNKIVKSIIDILNELKIKGYDEESNTGVIKHILVRTSYHYNEIMVTLVTAGEEFKNKDKLIEKIIENNPEITSLIQNINSKITNVILGEKEILLNGKKYLKDSILGNEYQISSKSFYQINPIQVEKLYEKSIQFADLKENETVLDAYCGIGTISLSAANKVNKVYGVEIVSDAIKNAKTNAKLNNISNCEFVCDSAENYIGSLLKNNVHIDTVFVDPPRKGLDKKFIESLLQLKPNKIIYISCGCESLGRDLEILVNNYNLLDVQPVDMFPFTQHVETCVKLILKGEIL